MTGTDCGLFTHKSVPVIFEPPCICICMYIYIYMYISTKHTKLLSKDTLLYFKFVRLVSACKPFSGSSYKHLQVVPNCYGLLKFRYTYYQLRLHCALI